MKTRTIAFLLAVMLMMSLTACGSTNDTADGVTKDPAKSTGAVEVPKATEPAPVVLESSGSLGEYDVQINDFELVSDYEGSPAILIGFTFTNNSEENESAMFALSYDAYQNGLQLESAIIADDSVYNSDDLMKEIKPGASLDVTAAYTLDSETAPVEFEVTECFGLDGAKLGKTFEIAEGGVTELSVAPGTETAQVVGDYAVSIISYRLGEDYEGKKAILIDLGFTNNSDDTTSYTFAIDLTAFQDGIELESAITSGEGVGNSQLRNVKPGAGTAVTVAFLLTSDTSPVEIEIEEYFSFSGEKIEAEINIAE